MVGGHLNEPAAWAATSTNVLDATIRRRRSPRSGRSVDWYHNLLANAEATIEVGAETKAVRARVTEGDERDAIWATQKERYPGFADYERQTSRKIPVVILEPTS